MQADRNLRKGAKWAVLVTFDRLQVLDLSGNGLRATAVGVLVDVLLSQPPRPLLLDLSHNPIGEAKPLNSLSDYKRV